LVPIVREIVARFFQFKLEATPFIPLYESFREMEFEKMYTAGLGFKLLQKRASTLTGNTRDFLMDIAGRDFIGARTVTESLLDRRPGKDIPLPSLRSLDPQISIKRQVREGKGVFKERPLDAYFAAVSRISAEDDRGGGVRIVRPALRFPFGRTLLSLDRQIDAKCPYISHRRLILLLSPYINNDGLSSQSSVTPPVPPTFIPYNSEMRLLSSRAGRPSGSPLFFAHDVTLDSGESDNVAQADLEVLSVDFHRC